MEPLDATTEPPMRARRVRGAFLLLWLPALAACFAPVALDMSPLRAVAALGTAITRPVVRDLIYLDRPTQLLLLALAVIACSPLVAIPWRLAFGWRSPDSPLTLRTGRMLLGVLAAANALALALLVLGVLQGDASMLAPLAGELVGFALLGVLVLPAWRSLPRATRLLGALDAAYAAGALAACATLRQSPQAGWWLLAAGAAVAVAEIALLPREER